MSKHTPGPWKCGQESVDPEWWIVTIEGGLIVANVNAHFCQEANARLIAAAPDMLAVLKQVVAQIEDYERVNNLAPSPGRQHCWDSVARAHEIIAKAEGVSLIAEK